ncbi:MFS transporter [Paracoccus albus]|uniref:MFS transporter n=1 Tax=Paracoccus albus TaxID=3017784 RepID=UPI0022F00033|nr:MFS transporter [Paracoccus albus]WBU60576.1 MFS transporter [Paracoccus albus]
MKMITNPEGSSSANVILICVAAATSLALIIFCAPLTTASATVASLGGSVGLQAWVLSAMPLGAAAGLLCAGAMGDALGRRNVFVAGLWLTALASLVTTLANSGVVFVAGRIGQGLGCAAILACGLGLIGQAFKGEDRIRASRIWAASLGLGVAVGPIICSLLLSFSGWRLSYALISFAAVFLALGAQYALPRASGNQGRIDYLGAAFIMIGLVLFLAALIQMRSGLTVSVGGLAIVGTAFLVAFLWQQRRAKNPILTLDLFRNRDFVVATTGAFASGAGVLAIMASVPVILQQGYHLNPIAASLVILAWSGLTAVTALSAGALTRGLSPRAVLIGSLAGCAVGQAMLLFLQEGSVWELALPGLIVAGISNGVLNAALGHQAVESVPDERAAMGSGANNTARYLGSAIGFAVIALLVAHGFSQQDLFLGWSEAVLASVAFSMVGLLVVIFAKTPGPGAAS